ncbi:MAG: thioredoxin [Desulfobacterales bacterium]
MQEISSESAFNKSIKNGVTLMDFNAPWCAPCRAQEPILAKIARNFQEKVSVFNVNVDINRNIAMKLGIRSIPTLVIFKNGREIQRFVGVQDEVMLSEAMENLLMDKSSNRQFPSVSNKKCFKNSITENDRKLPDLYRGNS